MTLRDIRNGIAVQSASLEGIQNLADAINEHPSTKNAFVLRRPAKRRPQFRVSGVDPDLLSAEFLVTLRAQNPDIQIEADEFTMRTFFKEKSGNRTFIFDLTPSGYNKIKHVKRLTLGWTSCPLYENFFVPKCYRCSTYGHTKKFCPSESEFCVNCAGSHATEQCRVIRQDDKRCRACVTRRVDARHHFGAVTCGTLAFHESRLRGRTEYPT